MKNNVVELITKYDLKLSTTVLYFYLLGLIIYFLNLNSLDAVYAFPIFMYLSFGVMLKILYLCISLSFLNYCQDSDERAEKVKQYSGFSFILSVLWFISGPFLGLALLGIYYGS